MLKTHKFLGSNIELYLNYDGKAFRIAIWLFFIFKTSIFNLVVHSTQKQLKMTKKNWAGRAPTCSLTKRIRLVSATYYIIGQARPKKGEARSAFLVLEV